MSKSDSDNDSSGDEDFEAHAHLFRSSLDVGSHFIDIVPDNELIFHNHQGTLITQLTIKNVTSKAHVAYFVFTSAPYPIMIMPKHGFIPPMYQQVINIGWQDKPNPDQLSHAMFFIKALPLSHDMNVRIRSALIELQQEISIDVISTRLNLLKHSPYKLFILLFEFLYPLVDLSLDPKLNNFRSFHFSLIDLSFQLGNFNLLLNLPLIGIFDPFKAVYIFNIYWFLIVA